MTFLTIGYIAGIKDGKVIGERMKAEEIRIRLLTEYRAGMTKPMRIPLRDCGLDAYVMNHNGMPRTIMVKDVRR